MQTNKPRLKAVESLVPKGARLLDIGADHGLLPLRLLARGDIYSAYLTDVNKGPLAACRHRALVDFPHLMDYIGFAISDGFKEVDPRFYDFVTICGMGGELIARIIEEGGEKAHRSMALQPMSHAEKLRAFLWTHGFTIKEELYPREGHRSYVVMLVKYTGRGTRFTATDTYLGKKRPKTEEYWFYVKGLAKTVKKRLEGETLAGNKRNANTLKRVLTAIESLGYLE